MSIVSGKSFDHECSLYAEQTIAQTIENALAQNFDGHEIVVVNENRTTAVIQRNRGAAAARNTAIGYSTGKVRRNSGFR